MLGQAKPVSEDILTVGAESRGHRVNCSRPRLKSMYRRNELERPKVWMTDLHDAAARAQLRVAVEILGVLDRRGGNSCLLQ